MAAAATKYDFPNTPDAQSAAEGKHPGSALAGAALSGVAMMCTSSVSGESQPDQASTDEENPLSQPLDASVSVSASASVDSAATEGCGQAPAPVMLAAGSLFFSAPPRSGRRFKGVRHRRWGRYICEIRDAIGKRIWLGSYDGEEEAARVYDMAARILQGEGAWLNFPHDPAGPVTLPRATVQQLLAHKRNTGYRLQGTPKVKGKGKGKEEAAAAAVPATESAAEGWGAGGGGQETATAKSQALQARKRARGGSGGSPAGSPKKASLCAPQTSPSSDVSGPAGASKATAVRRSCPPAMPLAPALPALHLLSLFSCPFSSAEEAAATALALQGSQCSFCFKRDKGSPTFASTTACLGFCPSITNAATSISGPCFSSSSSSSTSTSSCSCRYCCNCQDDAPLGVAASGQDMPQGDAWLGVLGMPHSPWSCLWDHGDLGTVEVVPCLWE